jgi:glycosyltransferase involved in cell wall biosynthesis
MKILWLASWYPSKNDPLTGDFFQRHANVAAINHTINVIHVKRDDQIKTRTDFSFSCNNNLSEKIVLYKPFLHTIKFISTFVSAVYWWRFITKEVNEHIKTYGKPDIIHVQAAWKCGLIALRYKKRLGIPYFISEQYTGYFEEAKNIVPTFNFLQHYFLKRIFRNANKVLPVSDYLGKALQKKYRVSYAVLDNVIDTSIFKPSDFETKNSVFTILHVSLFNLQKNPFYLLQACNELAQKKLAFVIQIVGPEKIIASYLINFPLLKNHVQIIPETNQLALAKLMQQADVFIFPSLFESFGLVPYEAIACGTPVIVSDIEVFTRKLNNKPFVKFCKLSDYESLVQQLLNLIYADKEENNKLMFDFIEENFSPNSLAIQFKSIYKEGL